MNEDLWNALAQAPRPTLAELFAAEPDRLDRLSLEVGDTLFDCSKTHLSQAAIADFVELCHQPNEFGAHVRLTAY